MIHTPLLQFSGGSGRSPLQPPWRIVEINGCLRCSSNECEVTDQKAKNGFVRVSNLMPLDFGSTTTACLPASRAFVRAMLQAMSSQRVLSMDRFTLSRWRPVVWFVLWGSSQRGRWRRPQFITPLPAYNNTWLRMQGFPVSDEIQERRQSLQLLRLVMRMKLREHPTAGI